MRHRTSQRCAVITQSIVTKILQFRTCIKLQMSTPKFGTENNTTLSNYDAPLLSPRTPAKNSKRNDTLSRSMDEAFFCSINTEEAFSLQKRATPNLLAEVPPPSVWRMLRSTPTWHGACDDRRRFYDDCASVTGWRAQNCCRYVGNYGCTQQQLDIPTGAQLCNCTEMQSQVELGYQSNL